MHSTTTRINVFYSQRSQQPQPAHSTAHLPGLIAVLRWPKVVGRDGQAQRKDTGDGAAGAYAESMWVRCESERVRLGVRHPRFCKGGCGLPTAWAAEHACRCKSGQVDHAADGRKRQRPVVELVMINVVEQQQRQLHLEAIGHPPGESIWVSFLSARARKCGAHQQISVYVTGSDTRLREKRAGNSKNKFAGSARVAVGAVPHVMTAKRAQQSARLMGLSLRSM